MMTAASGNLQMYEQRNQGVAEITATHQTARACAETADTLTSQLYLSLGTDQFRGHGLNL